MTEQFLIVWLQKDEAEDQC